MFTEGTLARRLNTLETLRAEPKVAAYLSWVRKRSGLPVQGQALGGTVLARRCPAGLRRGSLRRKPPGSIGR